MRKLGKPGIDPNDALVKCIDGVSNELIKTHYLANQAHLQKGITDFELATATFSWCNLQRVPNGNKARVIVGSLTKEQLIKLYSSYMVGSTGAARQIYDDILVAANGKCPFCAGIGHAKTLDHYVPKANFPLYSIVPTNLVPCCRDCNSEKLSTFPTSTDAQTIHPYLDNAHFFTEKWTCATVIKTEPISIHFETCPPRTWARADQHRVASHFKNYNLASRFSIEAAAEISILVDQRRTIYRDYSAVEFRSVLVEQGQTPSISINGWRRTLYTALAEAAWFSEIEF
jgi:hypothetical protein